MNKKLYVGGLSWGTTEEGLNEAFSQAGPVASAWIKIDRETGRSGGFGFVEMETVEAAQAAIDMWHGKELDGRTLTVNEARPQEERAPRSGGFNRGGGGYQRGGGGGRRY
jgi:RNA recognition motif-containing protein